MSNHITASVEFYYKGEKLTATIELDLDQHMQAAGQLPNLYPILAKALNLDLYSYEYEMMQSEDIVFNNAKGLAVEHLSEGLFDFESFDAAWTENTLLEKLQEIAQRHLSIDDLHQLITETHEKDTGNRIIFSDG
jgi:DNA-binding transcriptional regulator YhcF (GntR family)